jgi:hypothetical protein
VVNDCNRENIEGKLGRIHFSETMTTLFLAFSIFLDLFSNIVKENAEGNIGSIFSYVY